MQTLDAQLGPSLVRPYSLCNYPREKGRYVCGPEGFMTHVVAEATAAGRHPGQLHTERFAPAAARTPRTPPRSLTRDP